MSIKNCLDQGSFTKYGISTKRMSLTEEGVVYKLESKEMKQESVYVQVEYDAISFSLSVFAADYREKIPPHTSVAVSLWIRDYIDRVKKALAANPSSRLLSVTQELTVHYPDYLVFDEKKFIAQNRPMTIMKRAMKEAGLQHLLIITVSLVLLAFVFWIINLGGTSLWLNLPVVITLSGIMGRSCGKMVYILQKIGRGSFQLHHKTKPWL